jgi:hypothetical protein
MTDGQAWEAIPGETPIDTSGLKIRGVRTRDELDTVEAENIRKESFPTSQGGVGPIFFAHVSISSLVHPSSSRIKSAMMRA